MPFVFVPLATRRAVDAAVVDQARLARLFTRLGIPADMGVFIFSPKRPRVIAARGVEEALAAAEPLLEGSADEATVYSRMFAPGLGVAEDPATGAASGPLGCYLVRHRPRRRPIAPAGSSACRA